MRPKALLFLIALSAVLFLVTFFVTRAFRAEQRRLAQYWLTLGNEALASSRPEDAITAYQTVLLYGHETGEYQFKLAKSLAAAGRVDEAEAYFKGLWQSEPGSAVVNLELARLAARQNDRADAVRFFQGAIYGAWPDHPAENRTETRLELIRFLLGQGARPQADAELIALQAELPDTAAAHQNVADLFMQVQDYRRAMDEYQQAANINPKDADALAGAGRAAFELGQYKLSRKYLRHALQGGTADASVASTLEVLDAMFELNAYEPRITEQTRRDRALRAFLQAGTRLQQCAAQAPADLQQEFEQWQQLKPRMTERALRRDPDLIGEAMSLAFRIEMQAGPQCGPPAVADTALKLLARQRQGI